MNTFQSAKNFVYRNARPLDLARFKYFFEHGNVNDVLNALTAYQNEDGGFGHALEPDNFNPNSTPIATWYATAVLNEVGFDDKNHPIIKNILKYLGSGKDFKNGKWFNTVASTNNYPHAIWWECKDQEGEPSDNPTVSLAGFALRFAEKDSKLYSLAADIAAKSVNEFISNPTDEFHTLRCFCELLNHCEKIDNFNLFDLDLFKEVLINKVNQTICNDPEKWYTEYVCKPSVFFEKNNSIFNFIDRELAEKEAEMIKSKQLPDGSYPITWQWHTDYKEYAVSTFIWKSENLIKNILYLKEFDKIQ